jgi:YHS domain-containing protein
MIRHLTAIALLCGGTAAGRAETPSPILALKGLDPIALAVGKETPGIEAHEAAFGRFKYRFANAENKRAFLANPERHAIQFGGACGKMGPFSGAGNPERYFIHDQRIYIFASESCRDAFKKDPEKHIERPNPALKGTDDEKRRGARLVEKALDGFGGAKQVDALKSLRRVEKIIYRQNNKESVGVGRTTWVFPVALRVEEDYGTPYGHVVKGGGGFELYGKQNWTLEPAMRDVAWRQALREPLMMLRNRNAKGFVALARAENELEVALDGAACRWSLDEKTGQVRKVVYTSRRGTVGENAVVYSDFKSVNGVVLPHARKDYFNGKELALPERRIQSLEVNSDVKPDLFLQPK